MDPGSGRGALHQRGEAAEGSTRSGEQQAAARTDDYPPASTCARSLSGQLVRFPDVTVVHVRKGAAMRRDRGYVDSPTTTRHPATTDGTNSASLLLLLRSLAYPQRKGGRGVPSQNRLAKKQFPGERLPQNRIMLTCCLLPRAMCL